MMSWKSQAAGKKTKMKATCGCLAVVLGIAMTAFAGVLMNMCIIQECTVEFTRQHGIRGMFEAYDDEASPVYTPFNPELPQNFRSLYANGSDLAARPSWPIKVAVYTGRGASLRSKQSLLNLLRCHSNLIQVTPIGTMSADELNRSKYDAVVVGGGGATSMLKKHRQKKENLAANLQNFVGDGGGYVGFCAGAYLANYSRIAAFASGAVRGHGSGAMSHVSIEPWFSDEALVAIDTDSIYRKPWYYANGPFLVRKPFDKMWPDTKSGLCMATIPKEGELKFREKNVTFFAGEEPVCIMSCNSFRRGKVVMSTGHPEVDLLDLEDVQSGLGPVACGSPQSHHILNSVLLAANRTRLSVTDLDDQFHIGAHARGYLSTAQGFAAAEKDLHKSRREAHAAELAARNR